MQDRLWKIEIGPLMSSLPVQRFVAAAGGGGCGAVVGSFQPSLLRMEIDEYWLVANVRHSRGDFLRRAARCVILATIHQSENKNKMKPSLP
uniref:Uncharacterized protein n=1 Tax=Anopheles minimus TaxID=112268 RepID=A0A182W8B5_9DIPT